MNPEDMATSNIIERLKSLEISLEFNTMRGNEEDVKFVQDEMNKLRDELKKRRK